MPMSRRDAERVKQESGWIATIDDDCLSVVALQAANARNKAIDAGAADKGAPRSCQKLFDSGHAALERVRTGKFKTVAEASRAASTALRKFVAARGCLPDVDRVTLDGRRRRGKRQ